MNAVHPAPDPAAHPAAHPAAQWALGESFDQTRIDCTTTVVLKILDGKCKMLPGEKAAIVAIYNVVRAHTPLFDRQCHAHIDQALANVGTSPDTGKQAVDETIHQLRLKAEAAIPKPVMKGYKAFLREGLFG